MMHSYDMSYQLKDNTRVALSLVEPDDRIRFLNGFRRISARTNINRFHTFKKRLTEKELDYLLSIDNINHLAIGAIDCNKSSEIGIGLVRYIRSTATPDQAEAAIIIIDEYQGKGLGGILYREMMQFAAGNGIRSLLNIVRKDNIAMLHLLGSLGAHKIDEHDQVYEFVVHLANAKQLPDLTLTSDDSEGYYNKLLPGRNNKQPVQSAQDRN